MINNQTIERGIDMDVEIFSLTGKNSADLSQTSGEIATKLEQNGFSVTKVKSVSPSYSKIISALNELAKSEKAPDQVVIAEALTTKDSTSFRKRFAEVVAASEKYENTPVPKDYWRKRNLDFLDAKKRKADKEEMEQLEDKYRMFRKKSRIFSLKIWATAIVATALCTVVFRLPFFQSRLLPVKTPKIWFVLPA